MINFPRKAAFPSAAKNDTFGWLARPRSPRHRLYIVSRARETRNKTHHARSGGATGGPWCVLLRVSRARACVQRRYQRARMYRTWGRGGDPPLKPCFFVKNKRSPGATKYVFWGSLKNTWYAGFCANKKYSVPLPSSRSAKRSPFFALVFYVHETVQAVTTAPLFFC